MSHPSLIEGFHNEKDVQKMKYNQLGHTDMAVSKFSLGGGPFGNVYGPVAEEDSIATIKEALKNGINYIDTSPWYGDGRSERIIGKGIKNIPRPAFYIGTKVGRYKPNILQMFDFSAKRTFESIEDSLKLLGLEYVDIIQIHDLEFASSPQQILDETLPALEKIVQSGKARYIGITGYPLNLLKSVVEESTVKIDAVLSYARNTLIDDELKKFIPFFKEYKIGIIDAGVVALGLLTPQGPQEWNSASSEIRIASNLAKELCTSHGVSISDLAIKYSLQTQDVDTHLIGCHNLETFRNNFNSATAAPSEEDKRVITELKKKFFDKLSRKDFEGEDPKRYFEGLKIAKGLLPKSENQRPFI